jgi:hypothetical protein
VALRFPPHSTAPVRSRFICSFHNPAPQCDIITLDRVSRFLLKMRSNTDRHKNTGYAKGKLKMIKRTTTSIKTHVPWLALFLILLFVLIQVMPRALAQSFDRGSDEALISQKQEEIGVDRSTPPAPGSRGPSEAKIPATLSESLRQSEPAKHAPLPSAPPIQDAPGAVNCDTEPGIVIHDDGTIENGYSGNPAAGISQVRFVDKFTPTAYPASFSAVCLALVTPSGGHPSWPVNIVVYADDGPGGSPGSELGSMAVTSQNTVFPNPTPGWNSYDISWMNLVVNSGSVYIGVRWMTTSPNVFIAADESTDRPIGFAGGYWWNNVANAWAPIESALGDYRSLMVRAVETHPGLSVSGTDPAVGSVVFAQQTAFTVNVNQPVDATTLQGSDFTVNGLPANSVTYTPGSTTMTFHYTTSPMASQGVQTMHIAAGAFLSAAGGNPVHEFTGTFRYDALLLEVTNTVPSIGGTFSPPAPGIYQYDVNWNEAVDPNSVQAGDLQLIGILGARVTNAQVINSNMTTRFTLHVPSGGALRASIAAGAITDQFGNSGAAFSGNYTVEGAVAQFQIGAIYTKIPGHPTALVPGARDPSGTPTNTEFRQFNQLTVSRTGKWVIRGFTQQISPDIKDIILSGHGATGSVLLQRGFPFPGAVGNELFEFSGGGVGYNDHDDFVFRIRAQGGVTANAQKVLKSIGGVVSVAFQQGDAYSGLEGPPGVPQSGFVGNSIGSTHLLNNGIIGTHDTTVTGMTSTLWRPVLAYNLQKFMQRNIDFVTGLGGVGTERIGGLTGLNGDQFFATPDFDPVGGSGSWIAGGQIDRPADQNVVIVNGEVVLRQGQAMPGDPSVVTDAFTNVAILSNGDWYVRGTRLGGGALAVRNGVVIAKTGDEIGNSGEHWVGTSFSAFTGNNNGDWLIAGQTDNPDPARQYVIAVNGVIVARQSDPIDLQVPAVIGRANPATNPWSPDNVYLTDDMVLYFLASIQDGQGNEYTGNPAFSTPLAFLRSALPLGNPIATGAASRKNHGASGNFDIPLPLTGNAGIECRSDGATGDYTMVVTFLANVSVAGTPQATVTSGIGTIGSGGVSNGGVVITSGNVVTIPLTNVADAQTLQVTLHDVNGTSNVTIPMSVLVGDVNASGSVTASDVSLVKSQSGQTAGESNFRADVNASGSINAVDVSLVKSRSGNVLP